MHEAPLSTRQIKIPVGISACLIGERVRYDGRHKRSDHCLVALVPYMDLRPICPEMQAGLGAPRTIIRLVEEPHSVRAIQQTTPLRDLSEDLRQVADAALTNAPDLCGFVLTEKSPSCGLFQVKTYNATGHLLHTHGRGLFAQQLASLRPHFPMEEAARLVDPSVCKRFIQRVQLWHAWHTQLLPALTVEHLHRFWQQHRDLAPTHTSTLETVLAQANEHNLPRVAERFFGTWMQAPT